jgi:Nuclease-related domain
MPSPASPGHRFPWEDDDPQPGITIRPLSHAELDALIAELRAADPDQPAQAVLDHWLPAPPPAPPYALPAPAKVGSPGGSAQAEYCRRRAAERAAWARTLSWRLAGILAAGTIAGLLAAQVIPRLAGVVGLLVAAGVGWRLRFRVSPDTSAWRRGAAGERHTARLLQCLERHGWVVLHDLAVPGSAANIDHLAIGPGGVIAIDSKQYRGQLQLDPHGVLWHGRYPLVSTLRATRWEADQVDEVLGLADVDVAAIVAIHGASVPWGRVSVAGVTVASAGLVPDLLRALPRVHSPERVAWLVGRARLRFRPAT